MIKTRDLSWQDHTMNIEVMLATSRNQLLMSKHKTLASNCDNAKRLFERERESTLKRFVTDKRAVERKKHALLRRRSDILLKRVSSGSQIENTNRKRAITNVNETRGNSAPARIAWDKSRTDSDPSIFLTEVTKSTALSEENYSKKPMSIRSESVKYSTINPNMRSDNKSASQVSVSSRMVISPFGSKKSAYRSKSVRFDDKCRTSENTPSERPLSYCFSSQSAISDRVREFVQSQGEFNEKLPITFRQRGKEGAYKKPLIAKKNTGFSYDINSLENAFDKFCLNRNKDEFQKLVRMASKMKNNLKLARNQSIVPTLAAYKTSKSFKNLLLSNNSQSTS